DVAEMASVNGVFNFKQKDNQATFSANNQYLNDILMEASKLGVKKLESAPPTLEELFMRHYEGYALERRMNDEGKICSLGYTVPVVSKTRLEKNNDKGLGAWSVFIRLYSRIQRDSERARVTRAVRNVTKPR